MSNKKGKIYDNAKKSMKILKSGKLKFKKGKKVSLDIFIKDSINNTIVSRLDAIPTKEKIDIVKPDTKKKVEAISTDDDIQQRPICLMDKRLLSTYQAAKLLYKSTESAVVPTIVHIVNKKKADSIFDIMDGSVIGKLMRTSTLAAIYKKKVSHKWKELNDDDKSSFVNILYIPQVCIFMNEEKCDLEKEPRMVNIMVIAVPTKNNIAEGIEEVSKSDIVDKIITSTIDACVVCGVKNMLVDPYCHKLLSRDKVETSIKWRALADTGKTRYIMNSIHFCIPNEDEFIQFK